MLHKFRAASAWPLMNRLTLDRLDALLARAAQVRVLVVGDLMLDVYYQGGA